VEYSDEEKEFFLLIIIEYNHGSNGRKKGFSGKPAGSPLPGP
jgi:hypothetical protein